MNIDTTLKLSDIISIFAILLSPLIAVKLTRWEDEKKLLYQRRYTIFKTLLATRSNNLSLEHVQALNLIDAEFNEKNFSVLLDTWKIYFQHLSSNASNHGWEQKRYELFVELVYQMGKALKIDLEKSRINQHSYIPNGHFIIEDEQKEIRKGILDFLKKDRSLRIEISKDGNNSNDPLD